MVMVLDNRSSDATIHSAIACQKRRLDLPLHVFRNVENVNLGGSHKIAFDYARRHGFDVVGILHGDNQAKSDELLDMLTRVEADPALDAILGSRFNRRSRLQGYDIRRIMGNRVLNIVYSMVTCRRCEDLGSGINLYRVPALEPEAYLRFGDGLTFNFELLLDLIRRRKHFAYMPITWRETDQVSNAKNVRVALGAISILFRWRFNRRYLQSSPMPHAEVGSYRTEEIHGD